MKNLSGQLNKPLTVGIVTVLTAAAISVVFGLVSWMTEVHMHGVRQEALTTHQTETLSEGQKEMVGKMDTVLEKIANHETRISVLEAGRTE